MLKRLNSLEQKLDSLLKRFSNLRNLLAEREAESQKLKDEIKTLKKPKRAALKTGVAEIESLRNERDELVATLKEAEAENDQLRKQITTLEKELNSKTALEEETFEKLRDIISRIDTLEAEIGELENEQIKPDHN